MSNSNLQINDKIIGDGQAVVKGDLVTLHYTGKFADGRTFDSSIGGEPFTTLIGMGQLIAGWDEGLIGMKEGGTRSLVIPPELGYGDADIPGIPAGSTLMFDVELIKVKDGLKIEDIVVGSGEEVQVGDRISIHYSGTLLDGSKFDSSVDRGVPFQTRIGVGQLIQGWDIGIIGMKKGGKRKLTIPSELGYGDRGAGDKIPGGATLVFDVDLLEIL
jgi:FKBP-type peptidyl-prolyl cis-trans isomerase